MKGPHYVADIPPKNTNHDWERYWTYVYMMNGEPEGKMPGGWKCIKCELFSPPFGGIKEKDRDCDSRVAEQVMEEV